MGYKIGCQVDLVSKKYFNTRFRSLSLIGDAGFLKCVLRDTRGVRELDRVFWPYCLTSTLWRCLLADALAFDADLFFLTILARTLSGSLHVNRGMALRRQLT